VPYSEPSRAKWFYLLKTSLKTAKYNGFNTVDTIKSVLDYAQDPTHKIDRVVFDAIEDSGASDYYIDPDNDPANIRKAKGKTIRLTLVCPAPLDSTKLESDPTGPDVDSTGKNVETNSPLP